VKRHKKGIIGTILKREEKSIKNSLEGMSIHRRNSPAKYKISEAFSVIPMKNSQHY